MTDAPARSRLARWLPTLEFVSKVLGLALLAGAAFVFGVPAGIAAVGAALLAAAYMA